MITDRKAANAMGGKTARACDGCLRKRARWFCAADDAFLCHACDSSVHSANQLASRHARVRLETASSKSNDHVNVLDSQPAWHQGFTRKARTPRNNSAKSISVQQQNQLKGVIDEKILISNNNPLPLVPEIGNEEDVNFVSDEKNDQLLCRVPVFDPFDAELCEILTQEGSEVPSGDDDGNFGIDTYGQVEGTCEDLDHLPGFLPSDMDLAEFAADVENLLGEGLDEDSPNFGVLDCREEDDNDEKFGFGDQAVKVKDEQDVETIADCHFGQDFDMSRVSLMDWNFDYESPATADEEEEEEKVLAVPRVAEAAAMMNGGGCGNKKDLKRNISLLRLNYEAVITAWEGSPWTTGSRPELNPDDYWPNCMGICPKGARIPCEGTGAGRGGGGGDGGREARVLRYKEKRRTRLFSKKIRYEVRKLNAEKRPRMKGRFVKRTSFMGTSSFPQHTNNR